MIARGIAIVVALGALACEGKREAAIEAAAAAEASAPVPGGDGGTRAGTGTGTGTSREQAVAREGGSVGDAGMVVCKVMASEGGPSASADATTWLEVAAKSSFTVRTLETGRELRFEGPGRMRACADDVALVAEGSAIGLPGSGEAPGAEQWVATACGAVRWASGVHRFTGGHDACRLQSSLGSAQLYLADDVTADEVAVDGGAPIDDAGPSRLDAGARSAWRRVDARRAFRLQGHGSLDTPAAVKSALAACERAAQVVQRTAAGMASGDAGVGTIGELAAESVVARGTARGACSVAAVRVALSGGKPPDLARLDAANKAWKSPH